MTRYEWSQVMRRMETAIREKKDTATLAAAAGDSALRRECQGSINAMVNEYERLSDRTGLGPDYRRTFVAGFKDAKGADSLTNGAKSGTMNSDDAPIHAVGAASPRNPKVTNPETGLPLDYVVGRHPEYPSDHTMAGYRCPTHREIDDLERLQREYNTPNDKRWQKEKARYWVYDMYSEERQVELHWYQHEEVGKVEHKLKLGPNGEVYVDEWR